MTPLRPTDTTRVMAKGQDEYFELPIVDHVAEDGTRMMTSVWEPSPRELADLVAGGAVKLTILGTGHPPVMLTTQPAPSED